MPSTFLVRPTSAEPDRREILALQTSFQTLRREFAEGLEALSAQMAQVQQRVDLLEGKKGKRKRG